MSCKKFQTAFNPFTEFFFSYRIIMRSVVGVFGAICVGLVLIVEKLGSVLQLSMSLGSVSNGPLLGIFTLGVLMPWATGTVRMSKQYKMI